MYYLGPLALRTSFTARMPITDNTPAEVINRLSRDIQISIRSLPIVSIYSYDR